MATQTNRVTNRAAQSRWNDDNQSDLLGRDVDADIPNDRNLTDAEILLRDWCGDE